MFIADMVYLLIVTCWSALVLLLGVRDETYRITNLIAGTLDIERIELVTLDEECSPSRELSWMKIQKPGKWCVLLVS